MEYVQGESLLAAPAARRASRGRARRAVALQVASGARARARSVGVDPPRPEAREHPARRAASEDLVKLTDFGIAKIVDAPALTFNEQRFGTPGYIAPEYVEGAPAIGRAGDLYALGVVFYEHARPARCPFDARGRRSSSSRALREAPVKPSTRVGGIPAGDRGARPAPARAHARRAPARRVRGVRRARRRPAPAGRLAVAARPPSRASRRRGAHDGRRRDARGGASRVGARPRARRAADARRSSARWHGMLVELDAPRSTPRRPREGDSPRIRRATGARRSQAAELVVSLERAKSRGRPSTRRGSIASRRTAGRSAASSGTPSTRSRAIARASAPTSTPSPRGASASTRTSRHRVEAAAREIVVWEQAALEAEEERAHLVHKDLSFQIAALSASSRRRTSSSTRAGDAAGELEGALSALRRMTGELIAHHRGGRRHRGGAVDPTDRPTAGEKTL